MITGFKIEDESFTPSKGETSFITDISTYLINLIHSRNVITFFLKCAIKPQEKETIKVTYIIHITLPNKVI